MRRRGRSPTPKETTTNGSTIESENEFLDTDDQTALIATLADEAQRHLKQFRLAFGLVGGFAAIVSLMYPLLNPEECSVRLFPCWFHSIGAAVIHSLSVALSQFQTPDISSPLYHTTTISQPNKGSRLLHIFLGGTTMLHVLPPLLWWIGMLDNGAEHFHLGLWLGNVVTFLGALLLRWDASSTKRALEDLNDAKYEHKSL